MGRKRWVQSAVGTLSVAGHCWRSKRQEGMGLQTGSGKELGQGVERWEAVGSKRLTRRLKTAR
jgi:hypothetical protein